MAQYSGNTTAAAASVWSLACQPNASASTPCPVRTQPPPDGAGSVRTRRGSSPTCCATRCAPGAFPAVCCRWRAFLPHGVLLSPARAVPLRLPGSDRRDYWDGAQVVPWLTRDQAGPEYGEYVSAAGVGHWSTMAGVEVSAPRHPSVAAYLETVHRTLTAGPADLMGPDGIVWGCLLWDDPEDPRLDDALAHWTPVH